MNHGLTDRLRAGCIQLCSNDDKQENLSKAATLIGEAAGDGCELILLPENFSFMGAGDSDKLAASEDQNDSPTLRFLAGMARQHRITLIGGTLPLKAKRGDRIRNSCPVLSPGGELIACYDKMHLFDVTLPEEHYHESDTVEAGATPECIKTDGWKIGLSVCYDLRFPELYRHYSSIGCNILSVPSAFTVPTGKAHWETLLRARAIENQSYVLAAGQCGTHPGGRKTWGHSMIIDPWGEIIAGAGDEEAVIVAALSRDHLNRIRQAIPALSHRRM